MKFIIHKFHFGPLPFGLLSLVREGQDTVQGAKIPGTEGQNSGVLKAKIKVPRAIILRSGAKIPRTKGQNSKFARPLKEDGRPKFQVSRAIIVSRRAIILRSGAKIPSFEAKIPSSEGQRF